MLFRSTSSGAKISIADAKRLGLPLSLVGQTEGSIAKSLDSPTPPDWFREKASQEYHLPNTEAWDGVYYPLWDKYRTTVAGNGFDSSSTGDTSTVTKAKEYFSRTYGSSLTDDQIGALADRVYTLVLGGMTYAKAIETTVAENTQ